MLHVPSERGAVEAMEQRDEATVPVGVVQVDPVDAALGEDRRPTLGALADPLQPRRVDELHVGVDRAEWDQVLVSRMAQPEPRNDVRSGLADELDHGASDRLILEIEGQLVVRAAPLEQLGERGDVRRQLFAS